MKVFNILVINVTLKQHKRVIYGHISNQNMKVFNILVIDVTLKQHKRVIY